MCSVSFPTLIPLSLGRMYRSTLWKCTSVHIYYLYLTHCSIATSQSVSTSRLITTRVYLKVHGCREILCLLFYFYFFLFSSPESACLENRPSTGGVVRDHGNSTGVLLPGMEYTPTEQCQLQYGDSATHCAGMQVRDHMIYSTVLYTNVYSQPSLNSDKIRVIWAYLSI